MSLTRRLIVLLASLVAGVAVATGSAFAQTTHTVVPADKIQWGAPPPVLPAGAQLAVLEGNPDVKGAVTLRLKMPANYVVPAHWHSMDERVTVLSGAFNIGAGDTIDRKSGQMLAPGGFVSLPAKMHHYAWTSAPTIVQINLEGPFDIFYVNPEDNPAKTQATR